MAGKKRSDEPFHEMAPGSLSDLGSDTDRALISQLVIGEIRLELQLFESSGNSEHLWRAWRCARALGDLSPDLIALFQSHLDALAYDERGRTGSAERAVDRNYILLAYYHEQHRRSCGLSGAATSDAECHRRAAKQFGTTAASVKDMVMVFEGRGQRGRRNR